MIPNQSRDGQAMAGGVPGYSTTAGSLGEQERKRETPMGGFVICSTVSSPSSRQVRKPVKWFCSCTQNSTCSTTGPSARACECRNAGQQCTECYCWGRCKNRGMIMLSPTMARALLGHFPRGADLTAANHSSSPLPIQSPTSLSLREILLAGAGGGGVRVSEGGRRSPRDVRGEVRGAGE